MRNRKTLKIGVKHVAVLSACLVFALSLFSGTMSFAADYFSGADLTGTWKGHIMNSSASGWNGWNPTFGPDVKPSLKAYGGEDTPTLKVWKKYWVIR